MLLNPLSRNAHLRIASAALLVSGAFTGFAASGAQAQTKGVTTTIHNFTGTGDFPTIQGQLKATDGNFYGVSQDGGSRNNGFIYKLTPTGTFTVLHTFLNDGSKENDPLEGITPKELIQAADGNLYGICRSGGAEILTGGVGTFFKLTLSGTFTKLFDFDDGTEKGGRFPVAIVQGKDGNFYGLTRDGGQNGLNDGTFFRIKTNGTKAGTTRTEFFAFMSGDGPGYAPQAQLLVGTDGNFYGLNGAGGSSGGASSGTIFKATTAGAVTKVYGFQGQGSPLGFEFPLIQGKDGFLYGTSNTGGEHSAGSIFRCTLSGVLTILHSIDTEVDGAPPSGGSTPSTPLVQATDGNFYGGLSEGFFHDPVDIVDGPGGYYKITPTGQFSIIYKFSETSGASQKPFGNLTELTPGVFFGTTAGGSAGDGTIIKLVTSPTIISGTASNATIGVSYNYGIRTGQTVTSYSATGLPPGLGFSTSTGTISGKPTTAGVYNVALKATNSAGTGSATLKITVSAPKPVITSALTATATQGAAFTYQITASNSPTKYGASGLPAGLSVNQTTGKITGKPTAAAGTYSVTIAAFNAAGAGSAKLTLTVKAGAAKPVITSNLNPPSRQGVAFSYQITATNSPTSYGASGLPAGLSIVQSTGKISGKPTKAGTYNVTIAAFNAAGAGVAKLTLTVKPPL